MRAADRLPTLYELSDEFVRVLELFEADADDSEIGAYLNQIAGAITHKAESIAGLIKQMEGMAAMRKAEADRMLARSKADQARADWLRDYVFRHMRLLEQERIDTARFTLIVRTNPPAIEIFDASAVPSDFTRTVINVSVDKKAILAHVEATGEVVPGVEIVRRQRLEIR